MLKILIFITCISLSSCKTIYQERIYNNAFKYINDNNSIIKDNLYVKSDSEVLFDICEKIDVAPYLLPFHRDIEKISSYFYDIPYDKDFLAKSEDSLDVKSHLIYEILPNKLHTPITDNPCWLRFSKYHSKYRVVAASISLNINKFYKDCNIRFPPVATEVYYIIFFNKKGRVIEGFTGKGVS